VKWSRAVHHLDALVQQCAELAVLPSSMFAFRVVQAYAVGDVLGAARDLDWVAAALVVDLPPEDVPWLGEPHGARHWAAATRLSKNPITPLWRSARAPIWNHHIDRPVLLWDAETGVAEQAMAALREGRGDEVRPPAPTPEQLRERLEAELAVSLGALKNRTTGYDEQRWRPGKITPAADDLWQASHGYLDVLNALNQASESP
jgi:hypothetical protein